MEVARIMNMVTAKQEAQMAQASKSAEPAATGHSRTTGTNSKQISRIQTTNSSNGKQKRGACSSTGKITNISNMNSTSGSQKQMTAKNHKTSSSNAMSSAESKKIWRGIYGRVCREELTHMMDIIDLIERIVHYTLYFMKSTWIRIFWT